MAEAGSVRIGRLLARLGLCGRRAAHDFIRENDVRYQNKRIVDINFKFAAHDEGNISVNGKVYPLKEPYRILLLHKPVGYVCSHKERKREKSIFRLLPAEFKRYFFAGRLDVDSRGLVVLSNDGDLIYDLTHPSRGVKKVYQVKLKRPLGEDEKRRALKGLRDRGEFLKIDELKTLRPANYQVILSHGKKREIRRIFARLGNDVLELKRVSLGPYRLNDLPEGQWLEASRIALKTGANS